MKYTFQDSTELPVQRDFIQDLQYFIRISKELIPLDNSARDIAEESMANKIAINKKIEEIISFEDAVASSMESIRRTMESSDVHDIIDRIIVASDEGSSAKKAELSMMLDDSVKASELELEQFASKSMSIMSPFFEKSIYGSVNSSSVLIKEKSIEGFQHSSIENMEYDFVLEFNDIDELKVADLHKKVMLPIWVSGGLLHKEDRVKMIDTSGYHVRSIEDDGQGKIEAIFADNDSDHIFKLISDENSLMIFHNDEDITIDKELSKSLDLDEVTILIKRLKQYFQVAVKSKKLISVRLDGKDAIYENRILGCLKIVASIYGSMINECLEKGYNKNEIAIKLEMPDGTRNETYISKTEVFNKLSEIGIEGLELAKVLNVSEN
jgi:hypothetical protein